MTLPDLRPGDTALVIVAELPDALEALRLRGVPNATDGVPAHITLLFPFAAAEAIDERVLEVIATIVARHPVTTLRLGERRHWPGVLYASVEPEAPLRALQADLAAAFPSLPLYGGAFDFEPHVSIVEGDAARTADALDDAAWAQLPSAFRTAAVSLIRSRDGRWNVEREFRLADGGDGV